MTRVARACAVALALVACTSDRLVAPGALRSGSSANYASASLGTQLVITEVMLRPTQATDALGEWFELYNGGATDIDLRGYRIMSWAGSTIEKHTITSATPVIAPAGRCVVIGNNTNTATNGGVTEIYSYGGAIQFGNTNPAEAIWLRSPDSSVVYDSVAAAVRDASFPTGFDRTFSIGSNFSLELRDLGVTPHFIFTDTATTKPWKQSTTVYSGVMKGTPGICPSGSLKQAGPAASIVVTSPTSAPSIVAGNTVNFTAKAFDVDGTEVSGAVITWSTPVLTPAVVEVNATSGAVKGLVVGDTKVTASVTSTLGTFHADIDVHVVAPPPPPITDIPSTHVSEFHYDNNDVDANEGIEVEGLAGVDLSGWSLALYTGNGGSVYNTIALTGVLTSACNGRGAIKFMLPTNGLQNGGSTTPEPDGFALVNGTTVVQFLSYEGTFTATNGPAEGMTSTDVGIEESSSTLATQSLQLNTAGTWERKTASFGQVNACADATGTASISITHNGPNTLVVGWQRRAFATFRDANGTTVSPTPPITWTSDTPAIASVDGLGYATGLSAGTAIIRAKIGTTESTYSFEVINYEPVIAQYRNHVEFGTPIGADPANNIVLSKPAYVTSYNKARGGPNWVSWNINSTTFGDAERCECFSGDTALHLPTVDLIVDQDYVSGGYDRGHMVQSESRTSTASENAASFLMTNILPQAANNNQGPWLGFENFLNDQARLGHKQVYVVAGGEYAASPTTLKGAGRVAIPDYTWKVAIVVNNGAGLADVHSASDITVYAVRIPNLVATAPAKNNNYAPFITTVDDIEARTGYNFFAALPDNIENVVEANDRAPVAVFGGPTTGVEGTALSLNASASTDPDAGDVLSYHWDFGNGLTSASATPTVIFTDNGAYVVTLTVTDKFGATSEVTKTITISNVAPTANAFSGASILQNQTYTASGTFSDPGADSFTGTVDYGDGSPAAELALVENGYTLSHTYAAGGTFTVTVTITDDDGGSASRTATVTVDHTPVAVFGGPTMGVEGSTLTFNAGGSSDADAGDVLSYQWTFSNGASSTSATPTVSFGDNGAYTATLTVTDNHGASATVTTTINIVNVPPVVMPFDGASILRGESYASTGIFSDHGPDTFTATVDYGDGSGVAALSLSGTSFTLGHTYSVAGTFTVTVTVSDDDGGSTTRTATVTVGSATDAIRELSARVAAMETAGTISHGEANALDASLRSALSSVESGKTAAANGQLGAFINKLEAMQQSGRLDATTAKSLIAYARRALAAM